VRLPTHRRHLPNFDLNLERSLALLRTVFNKFSTTQVTLLLVSTQSICISPKIYPTDLEIIVSLTHQDSCYGWDKRDPPVLRMSNCLCQDGSTHPSGKDSHPVWRTGASPRQDISPRSRSGIVLNFGLLSCSSRQLLDREEPSVAVETMHLLRGSQLKSLLRERISRLSKRSDQSDYKMRVRWIREVYAVRCGRLNIPETAKHRWLMTNRQHTVPLKNAVPPVPVPVMTILRLDNTWFFLWIWGVTTMICWQLAISTQTSLQLQIT
jgi:hypothetical protein